jgi:thioredoxin reductase
MSETGDYRVRVAIVGAGPAGIGAAIGLAKRNIGPVLLLERWNEAGGVPAKYRSRPGALATYVDYLRARVLVGQQFAERLLARLGRTNVELRLESSVLDLDARQHRLTVVDPTRGKYCIQADAIIVAAGAREENRVERGWIAGSRAGRVLSTMQLVQWLDHQQRPGWDQTAVAGSDLIAHLAAAELKTAGAETPWMLDAAPEPQTHWLKRWYFRRWVEPRWQSTPTLVLATDAEGRQSFELGDGRRLPCAALVVAGNLRPNSELLVAAGVNVQPSTGIPKIDRGGRLSTAGCFVAGNVIGGFHGGQWCYFHGLRVAKNVCRYLKGA